MLNSFKEWSRRQFIALYVNCSNIATYYKTAAITAAIVGSIAFFGIGLFYTWPSIMLLKYAVGATSGMTAAQISALSLQFGSAISFWVPFAISSIVTAYSTYVSASFVAKFAAGVHVGIKAHELGETLNKTSRFRVQTVIESKLNDIVRVLLGTSKHFGLVLESQSKNQMFPHIASVEKLATSETFQPMHDALCEEARKCDSEKTYADMIDASVSTFFEAMAMEVFKRAVSQFFSEEFKEVYGTLLNNSLENIFQNKGYQAVYIAYLNKELGPIIKEYAQIHVKPLVGMNFFELHFSAKSPYAVLGAPKNATHQDIERAFRVKARKFHPDRQKEDANLEEAKAQFEEISKAKTILLNPLLRANYDKYESENSHITLASQERLPIRQQIMWTPEFHASVANNNQAHDEKEAEIFAQHKVHRSNNRMRPND